MHDIELISFDLCPYVQRSIITLLEKDIPFKRTNIDLMDKPDWFLKISPLGKVPVLRINGEILFESAVINEYLDEITPPSLHPEKPFLKARNRAWIAYASDLFVTSFQMQIAKNEADMLGKLELLTSRLEFLEKSIDAEPFFNGKDFALVDAAYAPFFIRYENLLKAVLPDAPLDNCPKIHQWATNLLSRESVQGSIIDDYTKLAIARAKKMGSYLFRDKAA